MIKGYELGSQDNINDTFTAKQIFSLASPEQAKESTGNMVADHRHLLATGTTFERKESHAIPHLVHTKPHLTRRSVKSRLAIPAFSSFFISP